MLRRSAFPLLSLILGGAGLAGCGSGPAATSVTAPMSVSGYVYAGRQVVSGSTLQLYTAGSGGNGSAASPMLSKAVQTDSAGAFSLSGDYTCAHSGDQVYLVATGGSPGLTAGTVNHALVLMAALGSCGNVLSSTATLTLNEVTTVAAAWALAPFMASAANVGSSAGNAAGLANAFLDAQLLANPQTGAAATLAANLSIDSARLYALADAIAPCAGSDGTTACAALFAAATPTGGTAPSNTLAAALNIVKNPGQNPAAVYKCIPSAAPFATTLAAAPNDWTMSLVVTGGGLNSPTSLDVDQLGNVWVAGQPGVLSEFSPQGAPLSGSAGFGGGSLYESYGLVIDSNGFVWVSSEESTFNGSGSVSKFDGSNSSTPGKVVAGTNAAGFYDSTISFPVALAADTNGDIAIDNYAPYSSATIYSGSGGYLAHLAAANVSFPIALAFDNSHGLWIANNGDNTVTHVDGSGHLLSRPACCDEANGVATDAAGNVWVSNYSASTGGSFSEVSPSGSVLINQSHAGGVQYPAGIHVDAAQNVWIANYRGESVTEIAGSGGALAAGTGISPATGYGYSGAASSSPLLLLPYDVVPDASGNLWVSNYGNNSLVMFFGLAAPTATPVRPLPTAP